jgi:membrane fusion protein, multidrug efflux system
MRYIIATLGLLAVLAALTGVKAAQISTLIQAGKQMQKVGPPPEMVSTAVAGEETWEGMIGAVGSVVAGKGVTLSNDAPGIVTRLAFESGQLVRAGQVLLELDSGVERAQLASIRARQSLAGQSLERSKVLVKSGSIAPAQLDADQASFKSSVADAGALAAQINRKIVRAPFAGRLGIRAVNLGQYLAPGTMVTVLESTESVHVDFTLPQQQLASIHEGTPVRVLEEKAGSRLAEGVIGAIDPSVDAITRAVKVRADIGNQAERLRPGMFVKVEVVLPERRRVVAIPVTAIVHAAYGDSMFTVEPRQAAPGQKRVAHQRFVRLGDSRGDFVSVIEGLAAGQEVVTEGAFKLRNDMPVAVNNEVKPTPELSPHPANR